MKEIIDILYNQPEISLSDGYYQLNFKYFKDIHNIDQIYVNFKDDISIKIINDLNRLFQYTEYFHTSEIKVQIFRLTYLIVKTLNIEYSQSFQEIIAMSLLLQNYSELKAYLLGKQILLENSEFYDNSPSLDLFAQQVLRIIKYACRDVYNLILSVELPPSTFICRLIRPLFARELAFYQCLKLFNFTILNFVLLKYICASFILYWFDGNVVNDESLILLTLLRSDRYSANNFSSDDIITRTLSLVNIFNNEANMVFQQKDLNNRNYQLDINYFYHRNLNIYNNTITDEAQITKIKTNQYIQLLDLIEYSTRIKDAENVKKVIDFAKTWLEALNFKKFVYYNQRK
ncbi:Rab-GTPase-TBC domain-containing protein [Spironucleus salmonicida]|uniref:TBC domain-containing protein n=1 Tax=Spironucleus salmonicida TaxID=348837 RepID=V6LGB7_9EUKA|nr:Rab-GTPase-TBC domain-containing protein [Spironucleus salmonicida]|eukprot:EST43338.1 TBC domain-containing protein [Spironucleus salmonicida]